MTHPRQTIRDAVVAALKAAATSAGNRVYSNRSVPNDPKQLPLINVFTDEEKSERASASTGELKRNLALVVEIVGGSPEDELLDNVLDAIADSVEAAMEADETFGETVDESQLKATALVTLSNGAKAFGGMRLTYDVVYYSMRVETGGEDFELGHYTLKPAGATASTPKLEGDIELRG
jgi:hypothetical protein